MSTVLSKRQRESEEEGFFSGGVQADLVEVPGVGTCIPAVDFVSMVCKKNRKQACICIRDMLQSKSADEVKEILCRKAAIPGRADEAYVLTYSECVDLLQFLPRARVKGILAHINKQFRRLRAGDESLHEEIDARAASGSLETQMARESLGGELLEDKESEANRRRCLAMQQERETILLETARKKAKLELETAELLWKEGHTRLRVARAQEQQQQAAAEDDGCGDRIW